MSKISVVLGFLITTVFGVFLTIASGSLISYIPVIGDPRQLVPLLTGLIAGVLIFTIGGSVGNMKVKRLTEIGSGMSLVLIAAVYFILRADDFTVPMSELPVLSALLCSPFLPAVSFTYDSLLFKRSMKFRVLFAVISSVFSLVIIILVALLYELSGQAVMPIELILLGSVSIVLLVLLLLFFPVTQAKSAKA